MKWIDTTKQLPPFNGDTGREGCTYDPEEVSEKLVLFCNGDDQYRTGWFCRSAEDGDFFEIEGIGDATIAEVAAWMAIPHLTTDSMKSNDILSPEEWLESQGDSIGGKTLPEIMQAYAAHVAARVHRNTRHRAVEILNEEVADYVENEDQMGFIIGDNAGRRIMQMPLR